MKIKLPKKAFYLIIFVLYSLVLYLAPFDKYMGLIHKVFYIHLPAAMGLFIWVLIAFISSLVYLIKKKTVYDSISSTAVTIATVLCSIVLITGSVWAKVAWGHWWVWDVRLTSTLVLWLLLVFYHMLRKQFTDIHMRARISSVMLVFITLDIPIIYFSVLFWRTMHPTLITVKSGGLAPGMWPPLLVSLAVIMGVSVDYLVSRQK